MFKIYEISRKFSKSEQVVLFHGDCLELLIDLDDV